MHKGFIEYCPKCHYHTDFHELSLLGALRQVKADWATGGTSEAIWAVMERYPISQYEMTTCPICGAKLESWYGDLEPSTAGPYVARRIPIKLKEEHFK